MRLFRVVHESSRTSALSAYKAPVRHHTSLQKAVQTSYLSASIRTCLAETEFHLGGTVKLRNRVIFEYEIELERIVGLLAVASKPSKPSGWV